MIDLNDAATAPARYDLEAIVQRLRDTAHAWVQGLFPNGRRLGDEWRLANIQGAPPRRSGSCVIMLRGEHAGDWHDFDGGDGGGPLSTLAHGTGLADRALFAHAAGMTGWTGEGPARQEPPSAPKPERDASRDISFIREHAQPIQGTAAERYLVSRGLVVPDGADLLFHPDLANFETRAGYPAMVALVRNLAGEVVAVHRTYLQDDGEAVRKADIPKPRMMLGRSGGGTVRLAPLGPHGVLGLCEGIETGLAAMLACPGLPVWAALSTTGLEQAVLPPEAKRVVILADHDASGAGMRAAEAAAAKLRLEGREVSIALPPREGDDFNDMLQSDGAAVVATLVDAAMRRGSAVEPASAPKIGRHLPLGFTEPAAPLPTLRADEGDLARAVDRAWTVLLASNDPPWLFRFGGLPTWVAPDDEGRATPAIVTDERMRHILARLAIWRRMTGKGESVPAAPPVATVKSLLATPDPSLPVLTGIVSTPVFGRGGALLTEPGYHPDARLLYQPAPGFAVPPIPAHPSPAEVAAARSLLLDDLLGEFPFTGGAERAHALSLLLLGFVRAKVDGPTPLHLIEKPTPGTGATLMVDAVATVLTGVGASVTTEGRDDEEWRKRITAKLRQIPSLILIDNLREKLDSSALAAALTAPFWEDRVLGQSEMVRLPIRCAWVATGNNPTFSNEMARRLVRIRLDARTDQPWRRDGFRHPDLMGWVRANRPRLVAAGLTLCQAWVAAGRPRGTRTVGSYEAWSAVIGGILEVAGVPDFLGNLDEMLAVSDAEGAVWRPFVQAWWDRFGSAEVGATELYPVALNTEPPFPLGDGSDRSQRTRLGNALTRMRDRVFRIGERRFRVELTRIVHQAQRYRLAVEAVVEGRADAPRHPRPASGWEPGEPQGNLVGRGSPPEAQEKPGFGEPWEPGEPFSDPYTRTGARTREEEKPGKGSPGSQGSPTPGKHWDSTGEPRGEPHQEGSPAPVVPWLDGVP
ncbi:DUF7146 domain-containing protein [Roseomonas rosulenta]|uniref:DUF7146 domain-containing protein n=1 Tax=Roseomonas rosulenta TaxID=2748667 RepID=UPI0018DF2559|nr:toprim domain-containing protein [Roseomonas rosulenta]